MNYKKLLITRVLKICTNKCAMCDVLMYKKFSKKFFKHLKCSEACKTTEKPCGTVSCVT